MARISQVTWLRSSLCSTATTSRGSLQRSQYFLTVMSSAMPFICIAPSPTKAIAGRSGWANLAPMTYGTPGPIVARVPDSEPRMPAANLQVAGVPVGRRAGVGGDHRVRRHPVVELPEQPHRVDRVGLDHRLHAHGLPPAGDVLLDALAPAAVGLALQVREQRAQGGGGVADEVDLVRVAHADEAAVDVDLDRPGLVQRRHELGVREVRADGQQRVAAHHHLVARAGAEQADGAGDPGQVVGQHVLAEQGLRHAGAEQLRDLLDLGAGAPCRPGRRAGRPWSRR